MTDATRLTQGATVAPFTVQTLAHGTLTLPLDGHTHLQFRRFAGCPICSLHLRSFAAEHARLRAAGVTTAAFFHSSAESLRRYHVDLPFPVIADPERAFYGRFGVERSWLGLLHPQVLSSGLRGLMHAPNNPLDHEGGHAGLPADFLLDRAGRVLAAHYGAHADDSWSVNELLLRVSSCATASAEPGATSR